MEMENSIKQQFPLKLTNFVLMLFVFFQKKLLFLASKLCLFDRGLQEMDLPDQNVGVVVLYDGHLSGLTNLSRRGDALLEAATDHLVLKFAVQAKDVRCAYWWRRKRIK